jgi:hydroxylamine dehydrogenase
LSQRAHEPGAPLPARLVSTLLLWFLLGVLAEPALAAKVKLDPSQWGHPAGQTCVDCHAKSSAGLTGEWRASAHAKAGVNCMDCHQAEPADPDAREHEGQVIAAIVSPKDCGRCHIPETEEQGGSVHAEAHGLIETRVPALARNLTGEAMQAAGCDQCHGSRVKVRGDGSLDPATWPNSGIGRINPDGSKGSCSACHGRHGFSKAQAREPEACVRCHAGPDSPDKEIFEASKHGMIYRANRDRMGLNSPEWVAGRDYTAAPTCATCHMGAAGKLPANHDVGLRDVWSLNSPVSERQLLVLLEDGSKLELPAGAPVPKRGAEIPKADGTLGKVKAVLAPERRRQAMSLVCQECHGKQFAESAMAQFDRVVELFNAKFALPARAIMGELYARRLLTPVPFDEPIEFVYWELWHDEGARARHGASMGSPNHAWWEGMYLVGRNFYGRFLPDARAFAGADAKSVVDAHLAGEGHQWLAEPDAVNPILGFGQVGGGSGPGEPANPTEGARAGADESGAPQQ